MAEDVEDATDVRMRDSSRELNLVLELVARPGIRDLGANRFERDALPELAVVGFVDRAHAALADEAHDLEPAGDELGRDEARPDPW